MSLWARPDIRKPVIGCAIGVLCAAFVLAVDRSLAAIDAERTSPLQTIEWKTYDWRLTRTARPAAARQEIALVEIDEYSLRNLEPLAGRWPWPRLVHASLLSYLARAEARLILYDVNFAEADTRSGFAFAGGTLTGNESDNALVEAVRRAGNVIVLADATFEGQAPDTPRLPDTGVSLEGDGILERAVIFPPFERLAGAVAGVGHNLFVLDRDGVMRHGVPFVRSRGQTVPLLGVAAALRAAAIREEDIRLEGRRLTLASRTMPLSTHRVQGTNGVTDYLWGLLFFRGPALLDDLEKRPYPHYSFFDLIFSEEQIIAGQAPKIDPAVFTDKLVFVGVTASGLFDLFETPFAGGRMPGIQVHAAAADDILSNRFIRPASAATHIAVFGAFAIAIGALANTLPVWWAAAASLGVSVLFLIAATWVFAAGIWVEVTGPVLAGSLALLSGTGRQYFVEGRDKRRIRALFGRYVSKDVCDQLVANPALARLGGQRRTMTVLFCDLRGFTSLSELEHPEAIVAMLNEFFTRMVDVVFQHHGTVDKFVGDMVMALFGAPVDDPKHARHAADAALAMVAELNQLNARWAVEGRPALALGIGISTGPMVAGNIGSSAIMSYTVIGDTVNLGARLESLNRQFGTQIIISEATREALPEPYAVRFLGPVPVKGKREHVHAYELCLPGGAAGDSPAKAGGFAVEARTAGSL